jgi:hypothetical protein
MIGNAKLAEDLVVRRREDVEAGKQPTVKQSLERLSTRP